VCHALPIGITKGHLSTLLSEDIGLVDHPAIEIAEKLGRAESRVGTE